MRTISLVSFMRVLFFVPALTMSSLSYADSRYVCRGVEEKRISNSFLLERAITSTQFLNLRTGNPGFGTELTKRVDADHPLLFMTPVKNAVKPDFRNGLMSTLFLSFGQHIPLDIRPDDVWISIMTGFATYVSTHAEELRHVFVSFEGRKALEFIGPHPGLSWRYHQTPEFWNTYFKAWTAKIDENLEENISSWVVPSFSTTTEADRIVSRIVLMGSMAEYFTYRGGYGCDVPRITLRGTLQDWQDLRKKAQKLKTFGGDLAKWQVLLDRVLEQFINTFNGRPDSLFWSKVIWDQAYGAMEIDGWATVFSPFRSKRGRSDRPNEDGPHLLPGAYMLKPVEQVRGWGFATIKRNDLMDSLIYVPVDFCEVDTYHRLQIYGGVIMPSYDKNLNSFKSNLGWAIIDDLLHRDKKKCLGGRIIEETRGVQ